MPGASRAQSEDESTFKFRKGATWTYEHTDYGEKEIQVNEVTGVIDTNLAGQRTILYKIQTRRLDPKTGDWTPLDVHTFVGLQGGFLVKGTAIMPGWPMYPPVRVYKLGSRKGDTWAYFDPQFQESFNGFEGKVTHLGTEEITVPAGTYMAYHMQVDLMEDGQRSILESWIVPKIGVVKVRETEGPKGVETDSIQLKRFTPGKEF